jgi:hypothetical protein
MKNPAHIHIGPSRLGRGSQATCLCKEIVTESVTVHVFDDTPMGEPLVVRLRESAGNVKRLSSLTSHPVSESTCTS